ncbi:MAG: pantoate--beta-alanine ligase [Candidatus Sericytochromatia bacterium]|nr:pantoate--beta-alanine ligase [Candidatus Tanganyikabacteria bacterium]
MQVIKDSPGLRAALESPRRQGKRIALVPTMGALHAGHGSLVQSARARCDLVVTSVYVNPTQFGPAEDMAAYPRDTEGDRAKLEAWGCDILFLPRDADMYPDGLGGVRVSPPPGLVAGLCGPRRPGHFEGVLTVVLKLLNLMRPHAAFFGQKDYQQWRLISQMAQDLLTGVEIVRCPIVREPEGLALSSRNAYLSPEQRRQGLVLSRALAATLDKFRRGERRTTELVAAGRAVWDAMTEGDEPSLEYLEVVDAATLQPVAELTGDGLAALAGRVGRARLIDNAVLADDSPDLGLLDLGRGTLFSRLA